MKSRMKAAQRKKRLTLIAVSLVVLSALLVVGWQLNWFSFSVFEKIPQYTVVPVKNFFVRIADYVGYLFEEEIDYEAEVLKLQGQIDQLAMEAENAQEIKTENDRLRGLLELKEKGGMAYTGASVIAKTPGNWFSSFTIDKGSDDGIALDMPVMTEKGLVGRVAELSPHTSVVRAIVDSQSAVAVLVEKTRDNGIAFGVLNVGGGDLLHMKYISDESAVNIGDRIMTSGLDGVYPKGLLIGTVKQISRQTNSTEGLLVIEPSVNFKALENVLIVLSAAVEE